jgi:hypothetical protein
MHLPEYRPRKECALYGVGCGQWCWGLDQHMLYILAHLKLSRNCLGEMKLVISGWQHVRLQPYVDKVLLTLRNTFLAIAGASATTAADALMNPFDGPCLYALHPCVD